MLKQIVKSCLVAAMAIAMAAPAMADVTVGGRVGAAFVQDTNEDYSTMDMFSDARVNFNASTEGDSWSAAAKIEFDINNASELSQRDRWVEFSNDSMAIRYGRQYPFGIETGVKYHTGDKVATVQWLGEYFGTRDNDLLKVSLKDVGVNVWLGLNNIYDEDASADAYDQTDIGASYSGEFGDIEVNATYVSISRAVNADYYGTEEGENDGYAASEIAFGVGYAISDMMGVAFNYAMVSEQDGLEATEDPTATTMMDINFYMGLDDASGIFFTYGTSSEVTGDADAINDSSMLVEYNTTVGGATVFALYATDTEGAESDDEDDVTTSKIGLGTRYGF